MSGQSVRTPWTDCPATWRRTQPRPFRGCPSACPPAGRGEKPEAPLLTRETYSVTCAARGCRWSRLRVPSEAEARALAREHARTGHGADVHREKRERVAHYPGEVQR